MEGIGRPGRGSVEQTLFGAALGALLVLLPFERFLGAVDAGPLVVTGLEAVWYAALVAWGAILVAERRLPRLPPAIAIALLALAAVSLLSAVLAEEFAGEAAKSAARSAAGWLLFAAIVDRAIGGVQLARLVAGCVGGGALAAGVAIAALIAGGGPISGLGPAFTVGGAVRAMGTFDYPNTAAMAWEATALVGLGLLAWSAIGWQRIVAGVVLGLIIAAMLLTLSRGAVLGATAGLTTVGLLALYTRQRRMAAACFAGAGLIVVAAAAVQLALLPAERLFGEGDRTLYGARYGAPAVIDAAPGEPVEVEVTVTNTGQLTWTDGAGFGLGYHWLDAEGRAVAASGTARWPFGTPVGPGESVTVNAEVGAPAEAGEHLLAWDVVQEGVTWFADRGVPVAVSRIAVGDVPAAPSGPAAAPEHRLDHGALAPERAALWPAALQMISERPLLGSGPGTFRLRYGPYLGLSEWDTRIHANSLYLQLAATTGLLGVGAFIVLVGAAVAVQLNSLLQAGPRRAPGSAAGWLMRAGLLGAVVAFLVHGVVDQFLDFTPTAVLFWSILGMGVASAMAAQCDRAGSRAAGPAWRPTTDR